MPTVMPVRLAISSARAKYGTSVAPNRHRLRAVQPFTPEAIKANYALVEVVKRMAERKQATAAQVSLAWVLAHPLVTMPIVGPRRPEHLEVARRALELRLGEDERTTIAGFFDIPSAEP